MILRLDIERLRTLDEVRDFMAGSEPVDFRFVERVHAYDFVRRVLVRSRYLRLARSDKGLVRRFLVKVTGFGRAQIARLISQYRETGRIEDRRRGPKRPFPRRYTKADIGLLAEVDETLGGLCGAVTRRLMQRQYEVFGDARFERLSGLSNSHLYRLRQSVTYRRRRLTVARTRPTQVSIGERRKPHPAGRPGFLRVDSVHQGDLDGQKGLYEINLVDEVTQYEFVAAVEGISERFLVPDLEGSIEAFPFVVCGFHADNGSEYVNHRVAALLRKPHVEESPGPARDAATTTPWSKARMPRWSGATSATTTSPGTRRPRQRLPARRARSLPQLPPALPLPRREDQRQGTHPQTYPFDNVTTPYLKLKSLDGAARYLRPGVTFEQLDQEALALDDLAAAATVNEALVALFAEIRRRDATVA